MPSFSEIFSAIPKRRFVLSTKYCSIRGRARARSLAHRTHFQHQTRGIRIVQCCVWRREIAGIRPQICRQGDSDHAQEVQKTRSAVRVFSGRALRAGRGRISHRILGRIQEAAPQVPGLISQLSVEVARAFGWSGRALFQVIGGTGAYRGNRLEERGN
jgi:hypothetical protein